jgi:uncharacterized protein (TIGR02996 family)
MAERKFLQAVLAAPDDDTPRLEYADWLAANGQPERAELIRVQIDLARLEAAAGPDAESTPEKDRLYERAEELLGEHAWYLGMPEMPGIDWGGGPHHGFERGFMARVNPADAAAFCSRMSDVFAVAPVVEVHFSGSDDAALAVVAGSPHLSQLRRLRVIYGEVGDAGAAALAASPYAARLDTLNLFACKVGPTGAAALARSPNLANLRDLTLNACPIGAEGAKAVLESPVLTALELLDLRGCFPKAKHKPLVTALRKRFGGGLEV